MSAFNIEREKLFSIIKNSYRKFKSHVYYANNVNYLKKKVADFEGSKEPTDNVFGKLCDLLQNPDDVNNKKYLGKILKSIKYKVLPKIAVSSKENSQIIDNVDKNVKISKVNLFFDGCIEIFILDTLWTLIIGKLFKDRKTIPYQVKANRLLLIYLMME